MKAVLLMAVLAAPLPAIAAPQITTVPTDKEIKQVCEYVAQIPKPEVRNYFLRRGVLDINNDGEPEIVEQGSSGTMGGDTFVFKSRRGEPLEIDQAGFEWKDYWNFGDAILPFGNRVYLVHFVEEDMTYPLYVSYVTPKNREYVVCEYSNTVKEWFLYATESNKGNLCQSILKPSRPAHTVFSGEPKINYEALNRPETAVGKTAQIDFDNDGKPDHLIFLSYASGAGRGCDTNYFDLLNVEGTAILDNEARKVLLKMQEINLQNRHPGRCIGNVPGWFVSEGTTYFENKYRGEAPRMKREEFHVVSYVKSGAIHDVCKFVFDIETKVKNIGSISEGR